MTMPPKMQTLPVAALIVFSVLLFFIGERFAGGFLAGAAFCMVLLLIREMVENGP